MAESRPAGAAPEPEDMHWGVDYLRRDIQDVRQDLRDVRAELREFRQEMLARFARRDDQLAELSRRMDTRFYWPLGSMATFTGILAGLMAALAKL